MKRLRSSIAILKLVSAGRIVESTYVGQPWGGGEGVGLLRLELRAEVWTGASVKCWSQLAQRTWVIVARTCDQHTPQMSIRKVAQYIS